MNTTPTGTHERWLAGPDTGDRMAVDSRATGLKPLGRHRRLLDWVTQELCLRCGECDGAGYHTRQVEGLWVWTWCRGCHGHGRVISPRQRELLRRWIGRAFPEAVVGARVRRNA